MAKAVIEALAARFPGDVQDVYEGVGGDDCAFVRKEAIPDVCRFLTDDPAMAFTLAPYMTAVAQLGLEPRFEVVDILLSTRQNHRVRLRVRVPEGDLEVPSIVPI